MNDIHVSKLDGRTYHLASLYSYETNKNYDVLVVLLDEENNPLEIVGYHYGCYDFDEVESIIKGYLHK